MIILSEDNLAPYIKDNLAAKLDIIVDARIKKVTAVGGGLVSAVYKAQVGDHTLYFKQAIPGQLDKVRKLLGGAVPEEAFIVWYDERQLAEVKALRISKAAVPEGFVPTVHCHDTRNRIMVLSEVCGPNGVVLADVMNDEIHLKHAVIIFLELEKYSDSLDEVVTNV